ncbi:UNVERIFIED_CONTAM: hypothetical protein Sangu_0427100 [Sesamum angustifolium]|uniref:Uncharacterized protein n=1 Tax=Sesamum angustifolium TaxID=2727405 RepID=A0AAW2QT29_9LAMI
MGKLMLDVAVQEPRQGVAAIRHAESFEEMGALVLACAAVFGVGVEIEGIVAGLSHFPVANDFLPEMRIHRVQQVFPVIFALDFSPDFPQGPGIFRAELLISFLNF